jgi:hypothetical protein
MRKPVIRFGKKLFFCKDLELYGISVALLRSLLSYPHGRATACDQPVPMPRDPIQWKAGLFFWQHHPLRGEYAKCGYLDLRCFCTSASFATLKVDRVPWGDVRSRMQ